MDTAVHFIFRLADLHSSSFEGLRRWVSIIKGDGQMEPLNYL